MKLCFKNLLTNVHFCYMIDNTIWFHNSKLVVFFSFWCAGLAIKKLQLLKHFVVNFATKILLSITVAKKGSESFCSPSS